ncbi:MAG: hypothetical protein AMXMBFR34_14230 [Myxococcaceae bacterium]
MASKKAKAAKKAKKAAKKAPKPAKKAARKAAKKAAKVAKPAKSEKKIGKPAKTTSKALPPKPVQPVKPGKLGKPGKPGKPGKAPAGEAIPPPVVSAPSRRADGWLGPLPEKPMPRASKLPQEGEILTKREMEQVLTVGVRGVVGEGSLKGKLVVYQGFPYLEVIGRDKRELWFVLQGPDEEVLPAYADHKVSVSGLIRRFHNYGGSVDVRKYSARKPDAEEPVEAPPDVNKLRLLSPGEVETLGSPGMSVGVKGFATLRGRLELSGDEFYLVVSNPGTRQQVAFTLEGKAVKGLKKYVGDIMVGTGVVEKKTGWGGTIQVEIAEPRAPDYPPVSREMLEVAELEASGTGATKEIDVKLNHGLSVKLTEKQGYVWSIEPQTAKRASLREVNVQGGAGPLVREFFFTPRNSGVLEVEFFLGKLHNPMQVARTFKVLVNVKQPEIVP